MGTLLGELWEQARMLTKDEFMEQYKNLKYQTAKRMWREYKKYKSNTYRKYQLDFPEWLNRREE